MCATRMLAGAGRWTRTTPDFGTRPRGGDARCGRPPSEWDDPDERLPHVHLHYAAMKRYTELLEERQGSAY